VAILASVFGMLGRFAGRILTTTLGWAGTLLFGQVRKDRQVVLAAITFGSVVWMVLLVGVVVPDAGTMLLAFVPVPDFVEPLWVRIAMLAAAIALPIVVGGAILFMLEPADRPSGMDAPRLVLRGYPLTAALAITIVFLAARGIARKGRGERETLQRSAHREQARLQDVEHVDFGGVRPADGPGARARADDARQPRAFCRLQLLGIREARDAPSRAQNDRSGDDRPGQGSAPRLIDAGRQSAACARPVHSGHHASPPRASARIAAAALALASCCNCR
jgi:hypothetical protein